MLGPLKRSQGVLGSSAALDEIFALNHELYAAEQSAPGAAPRPKAKARKRSA
jgi:hypothetical protein